MATESKTPLYLFLLIVIIFSSYIGYLYLTYIDEYVITGEAYGFKIGSSKKQAIEDIKKLKKEHPNLALHVTYGPQAGDMKTITSIENAYSDDEIVKNNNWWLLLDNNSDFRFFDVIILTFENQHISVIHRGRQSFELP